MMFTRSFPKFTGQKDDELRIVVPDFKKNVYKLNLR